ncbi:MAG TPA: hypothetical protein VJ807_11935 [Gaiellaceae bacterium]|nr:hypothetical protein [Gaiellaceae bacterium]
MQPTESEWLGSYEAWSDGIAGSLEGGLMVSRATCETTYDDEVGNPPKERLQRLSDAARRGCAALSRGGWRAAEAAVVRSLMAAHDDQLPPRQRRDLAAIARSSVGVQPGVYCWRPEAWAAFSEQYAIVRGGEEASLKGIADTSRSRIDLDPGVCTALGRYLQRERPSPLTYQNFELAEALSVLSHEAEHLKAPFASEAAVECYAVQHVRPLVQEAWGASFAHEIARHAWEISYLQLPPHFRTAECRDGQQLDRNPSSNAWP